MTIIQQLKANEKPFILMSEEMQAKAIELKLSQFQYYGYIYRWYDMNESWDEKPFETLKVYRLRADYEEEPEIVEIRIYNEGNERYFEDEGEPCQMTSAINSKDFIGFKFEDGKTRSVPIVYGHNDRTVFYYEVDSDKLATYTVFHATHVLFRGQK